MEKILIVDDQQYIQEIFSEELTNDGYIVEGVSEAKGVMRHLKDSKADLVLLDLHLKGFKGWDVLDDIKDNYPHLPVVIFTAYDSYMDHPRLSQADGYVIKSLLQFDNLKNKIEEVLDYRMGGVRRLHE